MNFGEHIKRREGEMQKQGVQVKGSKPCSSVNNTLYSLKATGRLQKKKKKKSTEHSNSQQLLAAIINYRPKRKKKSMNLTLTLQSLMRNWNRHCSHCRSYSVVHPANKMRKEMMNLSYDSIPWIHMGSCQNPFLEMIIAGCLGRSSYWLTHLLMEFLIIKKL